MRRRSQAGNSLLEFTLVGIPLMFILISIFEISRGMWVYNTLAHAAKDTARFAIVKGKGCAQTPNACGVTVQRVAEEFSNAGVGIDPATSRLTLTSLDGTIDCNPLASCLAGGGNAQRTSPWPNPNTPGSERLQNVTVTARTDFRSALSMFWPGAGRGIVFAPITFGATSTERIQF